MSSANSTTSSAFFAETRNRELNNSSRDQCDVMDIRAQQAAANSLAGDAVLSFEEASASSRPIRRKRSPILLGDEHVLPKPKKTRLAAPKGPSRPTKKAKKTQALVPAEAAVRHDVFPDPPARGPQGNIVADAPDDAAGAQLADATPDDDDDYTYGSELDNEFPPRQPLRRADAPDVALALASRAELASSFGAPGDASEVFPEYPELTFPSIYETSACFSRVSLVDLCEGYILPYLRFYDDRVSFLQVAPPETFYRAAAVHPDGSWDLHLLYQIPPSEDDDTVFPQFVRFRIPFVQESVIVLSRLILAPSRIPSPLRVALLDGGFSPVAPGGVINPTSSPFPAPVAAPASAATLSSASIAERKREQSILALRRATQYDEQRLISILGPHLDLKSEDVLAQIANRVATTALDKVRLLSPSVMVHLLAFRSLIRASPGKNPTGWHISDAMEPPLNGGTYVFTKVSELSTAIDNLRDILMSVVGERSSDPNPFFGQMFEKLRRLLSSTDPNTSMGSINMNYFVWFISGLFVQWCDLFRAPEIPADSAAAFTGRIQAILTFDPMEVKHLANTADKTRIPQQMVVPYEKSAGRSFTFKEQSRIAAVSSGFQRSSRPLQPAFRSTSTSSQHVTAQRAVHPTTQVGVGSQICIRDFMHKQGPASQYPSCANGSKCHRRHIAKPAAGAFLPADRDNLLLALRTQQPGQYTTRVEAYIRALV